MVDFAAVKDGQRATWTAGDFSEIAKYIVVCSGEALNALNPQPGQHLLDIACGTGNLAIPAAQRGAVVTGLDLTPKLLDVARARATDAGVNVEWIEGDAEALPFPDDSFELVASVFGIIFAPQRDVAAAEITRVCKPGGHFAITSWTREGMNGRLFQTMGKHMPPAPPEIGTPVEWGDEDYVAERFAPSGAELTFVRKTVDFTADSIDEWVAYNERTLGPAVMAKAALEPQGRWDAVRADVVDLYNEFNVADDGTFIGRAEYLLAMGTMPG